MAGDGPWKLTVRYPWDSTRDTDVQVEMALDRLADNVYRDEQVRRVVWSFPSEFAARGAGQGVKEAVPPARVEVTYVLVDTF